MDVPSDRFPAFTAWLILVAAVCHAEPAAAQEPDDPTPVPAAQQEKRDVGDVEGEKLSSLLFQ